MKLVRFAQLQRLAVHIFKTDMPKSFSLCIGRNLLGTAIALCSHRKRLRILFTATLFAGEVTNAV